MHSQLPRFLVNFGVETEQDIENLKYLPEAPMTDLVNFVKTETFQPHLSNFYTGWSKKCTTWPKFGLEAI